MRQTTVQERSGKRRRRYGARLASVALAAGMVLSMSVNAFAAVGFNGGSRGKSVHEDYPVHMPNGSQLPQEKNMTGKAPFAADIQMYGGTIYLKVGETVTIHLHQADYALFGPDGYRLSYWYNENGHDYNEAIDVKSSVAGIQKDQLESKLNKYTPTAERPGDYVAYCAELYLTGKKPGTEYFYFSSTSVLELSYYKVVITGDDGSDGNQTASQDGQSSSGQNKSGPGSTGGANDGAAKDNPNNPATVPEHVRVPASSVYTVKAGDTLASIALNTYGDMGVWPQLQEANREYLAQTKDGLIFAGFNLYLPADIAGGRIPEATAAAGEKLYTVKAGDTFGSIAQMHFGDAGRYREVFNRNSDRLKDINTLYEGQIIVLP